MGLYSINKVASVAESVEDAVLNEAEEFMRQIDECSYDPEFGHIMEAAIQLHENDKRMFDALIECDFISAVNESVMLEADAEEANAAGNEKKKIKISEMIEKIFTAVMDAIKKAAANIIYKITDLVKSDKKLYAAYKPVLTIDNLKDFPGIQDFAFPKAIINSESLKSVENAKKFSEEFNNAVTRMESKEDIDSAYETFQNKVKEEKESFANMAQKDTYFGEKEKSWKPTESWQISKMLNTLDSASDTIKEIKNHAAQVLGALKTLKNEAKSATKGVSKKTAGEVEVYKLNKLYKVSSETCNLFKQEFSAYISLASRQIAACRKAAILCGRYAAKKAKGAETKPETEEKAANESMIMWALGESSDVYVSECLGY